MEQSATDNSGHTAFDPLMTALACILSPVRGWKWHTPSSLDRILQTQLRPASPSADGWIPGRNSPQISIAAKRPSGRWEKKEGLPVRRLLHEQRGSVYAYASQLDVWLESRSHLGSHDVNSAGELLSNVAAGAEPEAENDESPSSRSGPKSWGESFRLRVTAPLLWMLPRRGDHGPADPPAQV
jgi:hypothetical protein